MEVLMYIVKWLKRIFGSAAISLVIDLYVYGFVAFVEKVWFNTEPSIALFLFLFISIFTLLLCCILLCEVNVALFTEVHVAHMENKKNLLALIPDIYLIVEFVEFVGGLKKE